jgi:predicted permease
MWRFWRRRSDLDFAEEIESHLAHEVDRRVREGSSAAEARAAALRAFGDVSTVRAVFRAGQGREPFAGVLRDARLAFRSLAREPLFALAVIATLALGTGLNTAVFGVIYGLVLRPLPLPEADRLVTIAQHYRGREFRSAINDPVTLSWDEYQTFRESSRTLAGLAAYWPASLTMRAAEPVRARGLMVTCDYFAVLRAPMSSGRAFTSEECARPGEGAVVVLSHAFWQRHFAGDVTVLGRSVELNRQVFTVIGITAPGFGGTELRSPDAWVPITMQPRFSEDLLTRPNLSWLNLVGRMRPGVTAEAVADDLTGIARRRDADDLSTVTARQDVLMQFDVNGALVVVSIMALPLTLLVIASLNVMNLLLARAPSRRRAIGIRLSMGASRARVLRQLLVESLVLAGVGGLAGWLLARATPRLLYAALPFPTGQLDLSADMRLTAFAIAVPLAAALLFGLIPALDATRLDLASALRGSSPSSGGSPRAARTRSVVMAVQLAGSLVMLVLAGLFVRAITYARSVDPGYAVKNVYAFRPDLSTQGYDAARTATFFREFARRVSALPVTQSTAMATRLPLSGVTGGRFLRDEVTDSTNAAMVHAWYTRMTPDYFALMEIPIVRGRVFTEMDVRESDASPAVISQAMAQLYWPGEDVLGRRFIVGHNERFIVVGVARDARHMSIERVDPSFFYAAARLDAYGGPGDDAAGLSLALIVRTDGRAAAQEIVRAGRALDPAVLIEVESLEDRFSARVSRTRTAVLFAGVLGVLATILAIIGVYGGVACGASQRAREIGVRIALGATRRDIIAMIMRQGAVPLAAGLVLGSLLAAAAARLVRVLLFGISPIDPISFAGMTTLLIAFSLLAMYRPSARAARLDPATTLRSE